MSNASFQYFRGELNGSGMKTVLKALSLAEKAHMGALRKDNTTPYIEHPLKVAAILYDLGIKDENILATAVLHDVLEDSEDEFIKAKLHDTFNSTIRDAVLALSKPKGYNNMMYYDRISKNEIAILVKLADRTHNLTTISNFSEAKKAAYVKETKEFIYPLIHNAQHDHYEYASQLRILDLWIESLIEVLEPYMRKEDGE